MIPGPCPTLSYTNRTRAGKGLRGISLSLISWGYYPQDRVFPGIIYPWENYPQDKDRGPENFIILRDIIPPKRINSWSNFLTFEVKCQNLDPKYGDLVYIFVAIKLYVSTFTSFTVSLCLLTPYCGQWGSV